MRDSVAGLLAPSQQGMALPLPSPLHSSGRERDKGLDKDREGKGGEEVEGFTKACAGQWKSERTYHFLDLRAHSSSRTVDHGSVSNQRGKDDRKTLATWKICQEDQHFG